MIGVFIGIGVSLIWVVIEGYTAPTLDQTGKVIKEGKKLSNLFKRKK